MPDRGDISPPGGRPDRRPRQERAQAGATAGRRGRSGYGIDSLRAHLREQLDESRDPVRHNERSDRFRD